MGVTVNSMYRLLVTAFAIEPTAQLVELNRSPLPAVEFMLGERDITTSLRLVLLKLLVAVASLPVNPAKSNVAIASANPEVADAHAKQIAKALARHVVDPKYVRFFMLAPVRIWLLQKRGNNFPVSTA